MSKIEVDKIDPQSGTDLELGTSGDTITIPAGVTFDSSAATTTLPDGSVTNDQLVNDNITINGSSVSLGGSTTIETGTSWQSSIVTGTTLTAVAGNGYWINTTSNACTITLPASASVGDTIEFSDYLRTWGTNAVTLNQNSLNFQGYTSPNPIYNTNGQSVKIIYSGATQGWIPTVDDDVTNETAQSYSADFLVVAGGGSGGSGTVGGGGGAGGFRTSTQTVNGGIVYTITVGDGGATVNGSTSPGNNGSDSSISGSGITTITSTGGGGGGMNQNNGRNGGSGGGSGSTNSPSTFGQGNTPSTSPSQGNNGGTGFDGTSVVTIAGGGGGAGAVGGNSGTANTGSGAFGGPGGNGSASSITGSSVTYAGGGGGNTERTDASSGAGGTGGGGAASDRATSASAVAGTANLGGGGGGGNGNIGGGLSGAGGKGVVIISVPDANYSGTTTGSPTVATGVSGKTVLTFNGTGSYTG